MKSAGIDAASLLAAFDSVARRALDNQTRLELFVYGGSALAVASNFRFSSEDIAALPDGEPAWLAQERIVSLGATAGPRTGSTTPSLSILVNPRAGKPTTSPSAIFHEGPAPTGLVSTSLRPNTFSP